MVPPAIDMGSIERTVVVPMDFAQTRVKEMASDLRDQRLKYEKHVNQLSAYYTKCAEDARKHYEGVFQEMKLKAQRHVEIEKHGRMASEEKLNGEITQKLTTIEALRDTLAANNLLYQQATRRLKEKHLQALADLEADLNDQFEARFCVGEVLQRVELCAEQDALEDLKVASAEEMRTLGAEHAAALEEAQSQFEAETARLTATWDDSRAEAADRAEDNEEDRN